MQKFMPLPHLKGWHFPTKQNLVMDPGSRSPRLNLERGISFTPTRDIHDPRHWRSHAEEMRVLAEDMNDTETRRIMNRLADGWDEMADRAERRAAKPIDT